MHSQPSRRVLAGLPIALLTALALLGFTVGTGTERGPGAARAVATSAAAANSCKPTVPVTVSLAPSDTWGIWHIRVQANQPVSSAVVRLGTGTSGPASGLAIVWQGRLAASEVRELDARYPLPRAETDLWVEVLADESAGLVQRARARLHVANGVAALAPEPVDRGRLRRDPQSGSTVLEYPGGTAVGR